MAGSRQRRSSPPAAKIDRELDRQRVQDDQRDDRTPSDYEREIDRLDAAARSER